MSKKIRTEVRLDPEVHRQLKDLAADSGLSMNQVIEGVLAWASTRGNPGRARFEVMGPHMVIYKEDEPTEHVCWFGLRGKFDGDDLIRGGEVVFELDYTGARAVTPWFEGAFDDEP